MKRNLKLLSGILMASFISNNSLINFDRAEARISRNVVVNSSSNSLRNSDKNASDETSQSKPSENEENISTTNESEENNTETNQDETSIEIDENEYLDDSDDSENSEDLDDFDDSEDSTNDTTNILGMLNSDKTLTKEDIIKLSMPVSHSLEFLDEFKTTFPKLDPLRQISPLFVEIDNYLDVNSNETRSITKFLNLAENTNSLNFSDQNNSNILLLEISDLLKEITKEINAELPSTIFSLTPTLTVFNDTYKILSLEYDSIIKSNSNNQITLNLLLKDTETKLLSLLDSIKNFKDQLPDLIETLNELAESFDESDTNDSEIEIDEDSTEDESTESNSIENEEEEDIEISEETTEEDIEDNITEENTEDEEIDIEEDTNSSNNELKEDTEEEDIDPNSVTVYFGEQGQELIYDEKAKKYYQIDPEDPDSDELIEYKGNVTKMTLAEYLDTDLYFDDKGNELIFDLDTNSYFLYDSEKDEFMLYSGEVIKKKVKDLLE